MLDKKIAVQSEQAKKKCFYPHFASGKLKQREKAACLYGNQWQAGGAERSLLVPHHLTVLLPLGLESTCPLHSHPTTTLLLTPGAARPLLSESTPPIHRISPKKAISTPLTQIPVKSPMNPNISELKVWNVKIAVDWIFKCLTNSNINWKPGEFFDVWGFKITGDN